MTYMNKSQHDLGQIFLHKMETVSYVD